MTEYMITITDEMLEKSIYIRESKHNNFFNALKDDLLDIWKVIKSEECIKYEFEIVG